jgi:hypothetical protein
VNDLIEWARREQVILWDDLKDAIGTSNNGVWSMRAADIARRLVACARLVGVTPHSEAPWPLVAGDVYSAVLTAAGIAHELPDEPEWRRLDDLMAKYGTTRSTEQPRYAATVAAINTDRERSWISGGDE